ncbi:Chloroperoxidase [Pterulicium gracile]|uniref:Chloroperoxidase n=1 Tax=Pterulicium gracile TaxID=1884261 RepID=A0A5C3QWL4_9AGAR|nr:Chloroperoxidase [Pterula gracilis]
MARLHLLSYPAVLLICSVLVDAFPQYRITVPSPANFTGLKRIPDAAHPYRAPLAWEQRGPCPGLNVMANHGYIPRSGVATFEQLIAGAQEAFNMDYNFAMAVSAFGILARGNPLLGIVSIGGRTPFVPPLPGIPDGIPGGFSKHGRFEGDVSLTRADAALGDHVRFQPEMYKEFLRHVKEHGNGTDVVTMKAVQHYRFARYQDSLKRNKKLVVMPGRRGFGLGEAGFVLDLFKNGNRTALDVATMTTFFQEERFPKDWTRRDRPYTFIDILMAADTITRGFKQPYGYNAPNGTFIHDTSDPALEHTRCGVYVSLVRDNVPAVLLKTSGLLRENVDTLVKAMFPIFEPLGCKDLLQPGGPAWT